MIPPSDNIKIERVMRARRMVPLLPTMSRPAGCTSDRRRLMLISSDGGIVIQLSTTL